MSKEGNESRAWSFDAARLARRVLLAAAAGPCLVSACSGGGSGGGNALEVFIAALDSGADARCACVMTPAESCSSAKSSLRDCLRQAVPAGSAPPFPSCAGAMLNQYNACVSRDGQCVDRIIVSPECDRALEAAQASCVLPPAAQACLGSGGSITADAGVPPGNGVMTPANDGGPPPDDGTPSDDVAVPFPTPGSGEPNPAGAGCSNECEFAGDGACDDGGPGAQFDLCTFGTDCNDCGARDGTTPPPGGEPEPDPAGTSCSNECPFAGDGACDDGGPGADFDLCALGTDCDDCGQR
jgi:hypothetical protein